MFSFQSREVMCKDKNYDDSLVKEDSKALCIILYVDRSTEHNIILLSNYKGKLDGKNQLKRTIACFHRV